MQRDQIGITNHRQTANSFQITTKKIKNLNKKNTQLTNLHHNLIDQLSKTPNPKPKTKKL
jgi:hypothetical protein